MHQSNLDNPTVSLMRKTHLTDNSREVGTSAEEREAMLPSAASSTSWGLSMLSARFRREVQEEREVELLQAISSLKYKGRMLYTLSDPEMGSCAMLREDLAVFRKKKTEFLNEFKKKYAKISSTFK